MKTETLFHSLPILRPWLMPCISWALSNSIFAEWGAMQVKSASLMAQRVESACNSGDPGLIPGLGEGNGNPLQYSCLENSMDRGAWWATIRGVAKSRTRLSN